MERLTSCPDAFGRASQVAAKRGNLGPPPLGCFAPGERLSHPVLDQSPLQHRQP